MKKVIIEYFIVILIMLLNNINFLFAQDLVKPTVLGSISLDGRYSPVTGVPIANDSDNSVYMANYNEVAVYDPILSEMRHFAGTGEDGTITEGIATEVPMKIQSITVGPENSLHILSEGYIGRVNSDGMIELLEFETDSGEITNRIPTITDGAMAYKIVFNNSDELFILIYEGSNIGYVIYKLNENQLERYVGGGDISLLDGNSDTPHRLDVKLENASEIKCFEETLYFSLSVDSSSTHYTYKVGPSETIIVIAKVDGRNFEPLSKNSLLIQGTPLTESNINFNNLHKNSISIYSPDEQNIIHLSDMSTIDSENSVIGNYPSLGYDSKQNISYIGTLEIKNVLSEEKYVLWAIPDVTSYINSNINDWNYHE